MSVAAVIRDQIAAEFQQGYFDKIKIKILDNLLITIEDVHVRLEETPEDKKLDISAFGFLMQKFEIKTVDEMGVQIFHDRSLQSTKIIKMLNLQGFSVYLNSRDTLIIHQLAKSGSKYCDQTQMCEKEKKVFAEQEVQAFQSYMDTVVSSYKARFVQDGDLLKEMPQQGNKSKLEYVLKPLSLNVKLERFLVTPLKMKVTIKLEQFEIYLEQK